MYLFLGRFEQIKPFWTCHTQLFCIIVKKNKDGKRAVIYNWLYNYDDNINFEFDYNIHQM
jgi:hypothetical protein